MASSTFNGDAAFLIDWAIDANDDDSDSDGDGIPTDEEIDDGGIHDSRRRDVR